MRKYLLIGSIILFSIGLVGAIAFHCMAENTTRIAEKASDEIITPAPNAKKDHRINEVNFNKIQYGMTQQEVEDILGAPPGVYTSLDTYYYTPPMPSMGLRCKETVKDCLRYGEMYPCEGQRNWYADTAFITIYFNSEGKVKEYGYAGGKYLDRAYLVSDPDPYPDQKIGWLQRKPTTTPEP